MSNSDDLHILQFIAQKLSEGRAAVLIGAGFSRNATPNYPSATKFPLWNDLANAFFKKLYGENIWDKHSNLKEKSTDPMELAEQVEAIYGRSELDDILRSVIPNTQYSPSETYIKLLQLPWKDVFTTNYDTLLERTSSKISKRSYKCISSCEDIIGSADSPRIIKLHGSFPSHRPFITTSEDYRKYPKQFAPFVNTVQQSLLENTFCLLGFSGSDPNFLKWIGWMRDNLGKHSPHMYLLTHNSCESAEKKVLEHKGVYTVDINSLDENIDKSNVSTIYDKLFDFFEKYIENAEQQISIWPKEKMLHKLPSGPDMLNCKISDIRKINKTLQNIIESYPQWLVMPSSIRKRLSHELNGLSFIMQSKAFSSEDLDILEFLYLYDWVRESCLTPIFDNIDLPVYERSMPNILSLVKLREDKIKCASILLSMMHTYREDGKREKWDNIYNDLKSNDFSEIMLECGKIYHRFNYECCLQAIFTLEFDKLDGLLSKWKVTSNDLEWALRKADILAENNQVPEANELLQQTLNNVRKGLKDNEHNIRLLSLESAIMEFLRYLEFSTTFKNNNDQLAEIRERDGLHRKYKCSIAEEGQNFESLLSVAPHTFQNVEKEFGFNFGTYTRKFKSGNDELTLSAYAFLRFEELVAIPYRLSRVTHSTDTARKAALQVSPFSSCLAVATLIRTDSSEIAEKLWARQQLSLMTVEETDTVCATYYSPLKNIVENNIDTHKHCFIGSPEVFYTYKVLSIILSHLCCKCTFKMRDKILETVIQFYQKSNNFREEEMKTLTKRLLNSYTHNEIIDRIEKINSIPLNDEIEPFSFISTMPPDIAEMPDEAIDIVPLLNESESSDKTAAQNRVIALYENKFLTSHQMSKVEKWFSEHFESLDNKNIIISFSKSQDSIIKEHIETILISELKSSQASGHFKLNPNVWKSLRWASRNNIFSKDNLELVLSLIKKVISNILPRVEKHRTFFDEYKIAEEQVSDLQITLYWFIVNNFSSELTTKQSQIITEISTSIKNTSGIIEQGFELIWELKLHEIKTEQLVDTLVRDLIHGDNNREMALRTIYLILDASYKRQNILFCNEEQELLLIVSEQIKWRQPDQLFHAINIAANSLLTDVNIWGTDIESNLLIGLSHLQNATKINADDPLDIIHEKGSLREISARLAASMIKHYLKEGKELPQALSDWKVIIENPNEFSEIRNLKDLYLYELPQ